MDDRPALTGRQREIMEYLCLGCTNQEISGFLGISVNTVKTHVATLYKELMVGNRTEAVHRYRELYSSTVPPMSRARMVAVLPFSAAPEELLPAALRLSETLTARLLGWRRFPVAAPEACLRFRSEDLSRLAAELDIEYAVLGALAYEEGRLRLDLRLLSPSNGKMLWTQSFFLEEPSGGAFDACAAHLGAVLMPELFKAEFERTASLPEASLSAWERCIRGLHLMDVRTRENYAAAMRLFEAALDLSPDLSLAYYAYAHACYKMSLEQWSERLEEDIGKVHDYARRTSILEPSGADGNLVLAFSRILEGRYDEAVRLLREAVRLNPCWALAFNLLGQLHAMRGQLEESEAYLKESARLSVHTAAYSHNLGALALFRFAKGDYVGAASACREGLGYDLGYLLMHALLVSSCALAGDREGAAEAWRRLRGLRPDFSPEAAAPFLRSIEESRRALILEGLRAGMLAADP